MSDISINQPSTPTHTSRVLGTLASFAAVGMLAAGCSSPDNPNSDRLPENPNPTPTEITIYFSQPIATEVGHEIDFIKDYKEPILSLIELNKSPTISAIINLATTVEGVNAMNGDVDSPMYDVYLELKGKWGSDKFKEDLMEYQIAIGGLIGQYSQSPFIFVGAERAGVDIPDLLGEVQNYLILADKNHQIYLLPDSDTTLKDELIRESIGSLGQKLQDFDSFFVEPLNSFLENQES
jgi:hypothetical protein